MCLLIDTWTYFTRRKSFWQVFNPGMLQVEGILELSTQTYFYNPSMQPSCECLVISWMVNFGYGGYQH